VGPVAVAAKVAVSDPGTAVSATQIGGQTRGPRGRWAMLLRRPRNPEAREDQPPADDGDDRDARVERVERDGVEGVERGADLPVEERLPTDGERGETKPTPTEPATRHTIDTD
jgi:hypothetical protein